MNEFQLYEHLRYFTYYCQGLSTSLPSAGKPGPRRSQTRGLQSPDPEFREGKIVPQVQEIVLDRPREREDPSEARINKPAETRLVKPEPNSSANKKATVPDPPARGVEQPDRQEDNNLEVVNQCGQAAEGLPDPGGAQAEDQQV